MAKRKRFTVQVRLDLWLDYEILAENMEDALAQARELKPRDIAEYPTPANDEEIKITGVYE